MIIDLESCMDDNSKAWICKETHDLAHILYAIYLAYNIPWTSASHKERWGRGDEAPQTLS